MIRKIQTFFQNLNRVPVPVDPSVFDDPVAEKTSWAPLEEGGANFDTRIMIPLDGRAVEFSPTISAYLLYVIVMMVGGVGTVTGINSFLDHGIKGSLMFLTIPPFFLLFGLGGLIRERKSKVVFDKRTETMYHQSAGNGMNPFGITTSMTPLEDIHAIQVISEYVKGDDSSYYSYELNTVLKDGSRINVMDHGDGSQVQKDARLLAHFLGVKYWNAVPN